MGTFRVLAAQRTLWVAGSVFNPKVCRLNNTFANFIQAIIVRARQKQVAKSGVKFLA
jgi:hypothetical protein